MKDFNELEKLEKLSKTMSEEDTVKKPKSKLPFIIIGIVIIVAIIVGAIFINNNKVKSEESKPDTIYENGAESESADVDVTYDEGSDSTTAAEEDLREANIKLVDNDKLTVTIISYEDSQGVFAVKIKNKTNSILSSYQEGESVLLDGKQQCIAETSGTWSFAYVDVPAKGEVTAFSTFRKNGDDGWNTKVKLSDNHTFEFTMCATNENYEWEEMYNVKITPDMFGY